ncbi:MAG: SocA family protein [Candidatus Fibromonas sp.]|jgi:uncharacterized phage-associated protein|nr:SocA family protein [Candidatus Fibromonas sp.]
MIDEPKALNAMLYVLWKLESSQRDMLKVFKILWFADLSHMKEYGRFITDDDYIKMRLGPVPSRLYEIAKQIRDGNPLYEAYKRYFNVTDHKIVIPSMKADMDYLSESDIQELDKSICENGDLTGEQLSRKSHGAAWKKSALGYSIDTGKILDEIGMPESDRAFILESEAFQRVFA